MSKKWNCFKHQIEFPTTPEADTPETIMKKQDKLLKLPTHLNHLVINFSFMVENNTIFYEICGQRENNIILISHLLTQSRHILGQHSQRNAQTQDVLHRIFLDLEFYNLLKSGTIRTECAYVEVRTRKLQSVITFHENSNNIEACYFILQREKFLN